MKRDKALPVPECPHLRVDLCSSSKHGRASKHGRDILALTPQRKIVLVQRLY